MSESFLPGSSTPIKMQVGVIFDLPDNVVRIEGRTGIFRDDKGFRLGKWKVIKIINKEVNVIQFKGKVITTYGHRRCRLLKQ